MTRTMRALLAPRRGGPEQLTPADVLVPRPAADELLVAVHAAAITFDELRWDETWRHLPAIPSHEMSGTVAVAGGGFAEGDAVHALLPFDGPGAAAEYVPVPAAVVAGKPPTLGHVQAAALPLAGLTALQALVDHAGLRLGERLLVHGAAGGVGSYGVQLGRELGAEVAATVRRSGEDAVRRWGAARVVRTDDGWFGQDERFDVVLDPVGGNVLERSYDLLAEGGRLVTLQGPPDVARARARGADATFFVVRPDRPGLERLAGLVGTGALEVVVAATYPLDRGRAAFESRDAPDRRPGKTVLVVRS